MLQELRRNHRSQPLSLVQKQEQKVLSRGVQFCWCPPGQFKMGSPVNEPDHRSDEAQVEVALSRGFWMGKYEVTQGEWKRIVGAFPLQQPDNEGDDFPVVWVNFPEAEYFCQMLAARAHASSQLPQNWEIRLPTEAQWEYACRAGTTAATSYGDTLNSTQANFNGQEPYNGGEPGPLLNRAAPVGSYPANAWGLHDMHGNVFEWCRDWYHMRLPGGTDPDLSPLQGGPNRDRTFSRVRRGEIGRASRR